LAAALAAGENASAAAAARAEAAIAGVRRFITIPELWSNANASI